MISTVPPSGYALASTLGQMGAGDLQTLASPSGANPYSKAAAATGVATASVTVTLSEDAKAALALDGDNRPLETVLAAAREALDTLLKAANSTSALKDGRATIDLSGLDRRSLWTVATNSGGRFTLDEQVVATLQLNAARDKALAGPAATARVTGDYAGLYRSYLATLDAAGPEEKATSHWAADRAATIKGLDQATSRPGSPPVVEGDPVARWLKESGGVVASPRTRDISKVASDVRTVLDRQYAAAAAEGRSDDKDRGTIDFSNFDDRSLSAVALNSGGVFSEHETALAASEIRARNRDRVSSHYAAASNSGDPSAFGKSIITQYAVMSDEERQASGWTPALYERMVALQGVSDQLATLFHANGDDSEGRMSLLDYL
ncbi:MAG: hypothetical protein ACK4M2_00475 [Brevundimonas sp.]